MAKSALFQHSRGTKSRAKPHAPPERWRHGDTLREKFQQRRGLRDYGPSSVSSFISKILCVLEIDLEIDEALPDKADERKNVTISNSPEIFGFPAARQGRI